VIEKGKHNGNSLEKYDERAGREEQTVREKLADVDARHMESESTRSDKGLGPPAVQHALHQSACCESRPSILTLSL
jgi:hypothetical protein